MGTKERREREAADRKQNILKAAREIFWKVGYANATMPQIAKAAELAPGTLYLYFPSKDALYTELLIEGYDRLEQHLKDSVALGSTAMKKAEKLIDAFFTFAQHNPQYFDIIFFILQKGGRSGAGAELSPEQLSRLRAREMGPITLAASVLSQINPKLPSEKQTVIIRSVWSMIVGTVFYFRAEPHFMQVAKQTRDIILAGIERI